MRLYELEGMNEFRNSLFYLCLNFPSFIISNSLNTINSSQMGNAKTNSKRLSVINFNSARRNRKVIDD